MKWLQRLSIKHTIAILTVATSAIVMLVGAIALFVESTAYGKKQFLEDIQLQTNLLAEYLVLPVVFQDSTAMTDIVQKTTVIESIRSVHVCDTNGEALLHFGEASELDVWRFSSKPWPVSHGSIYIRSSVSHENVEYGSVVVAYSLERLRARTFWTAVLFSGAFLLLVILSLIIAYHMQRVITKPVDGLLEEMKLVIETGDYLAQIESEYTNEFGLLYRTFNELMQTINSGNQRLQESRQKLLAVLDSTPFPVILLDGKCTSIEYWSQAALHLFGYKAETFQQWLPLAFPDPGCRKKTLRQWEEALDHARLSGTSVNTGEYCMSCQDGSSIICEMHATFIPDHLVVTVNDITRRKTAEEEKRRISDQLVQSQKMESVGRLAGGVAHDFNNMLQAIIGNAEFAAEDSSLSSDTRAFLDEIRSAAERSAALTCQLLAFARKQTVAPQVINLNDRISTIIKMVKRLIGEDIEVKWHPDERAWNIKLDPVQLDQIITNLAVNSRDALSGNGEISIEIENVSLDDTFAGYKFEVVPGDYVAICFSDNGCGIEKDKLDTIFEPFYTTKAQGEGTGLGLATVYGIVKQNEGFINVYSEPGLGTTFKIYLPRHAEEAQQVEVKQQVPARGKSEVILFVEDETAVLRFGSLALKRLGYVVHAAKSPDQALELAGDLESHIDLLISDVVMPGMNGRELTERLHRLHPGMRQLYISGYTANVIATKGILQEGVNFLQKPFNSSALAAKVRSVLDGNL